MPELAALELVDAVARTGSMSAAARELRVTQQAVSTRVRAVEQRMGVELFVRSPQGARLTSDGESVVAWTRDVLAAAEKLGAALDLLHASPERTLTVGGSQTIAAWLLPRWMLQLRERQLAAGKDATAVRLRSGNSVEIARLLRDGMLDLGFIESPLVPSDLGSTTVAVDRLVVVVPPGHAWTGAIDLPTLARMPLVARERGSGTRTGYELAVRERMGAEPADPALELATTVAVLSAVAAGVAPAVLSELAVADEVALGRVRRVEIAGDPVTRPLTALWRGAAVRGASRMLVEIAAAPPAPPSGP
ncbi:LysR family transcriptional regulator [Microbacterium elymi]|uniref:LysR family transcriptional regulator n=1 Tax=Microbacterium elymi TaxID=2909587 RepID=A0ABY5NLJ4_9MICO|nr:LysR family transcriptional regulator [Microbacterium elymi]UUT36030.1 LysR family transcriptional regulator [Microbacterium elymi]